MNKRILVTYLLLSVGISLAAWFGVDAAAAKQAALQADTKYSKNECVQDLRFTEAWEPQEPIFKILEVGKRKYKVAKWLEQEKAYSPQWESKTFLELNQYSKVACP